MRRRMRKTRKLKVRLYSARMTDLNDYLAALTGAKESDKIGDTELNEILWTEWKMYGVNKRMYMVFYCENITFKNMLICLNTWKLGKIFTKVL